MSDLDALLAKQLAADEQDADAESAALPEEDLLKMARELVNDKLYEGSYIWLFNLLMLLCFKLFFFFFGGFVQFI
jgi:hypothetical protein